MIKYKKNITCIEIMNYYVNNKLLVSEINKISYSNIGYLLLGVIIETVTKLSYLEVFNKYIFIPLKMKHTYNSSIANTKLYNNNKLLSQKLLHAIDYGATNGALYSCVKDLIIFGKNIISLLNKNSIQIIKNGGYIFNTENNNNFISHGGSYFGSSCMLRIMYDKSMNYKGMRISLGTYTYMDII